MTQESPNEWNPQTGREIDFSYDAVGNRTSRAEEAQDISVYPPVPTGSVDNVYTMDSASNRLLLDDQDDNGNLTTRTLGYDPSGNTDTDARHDGSNRTLTYDVRGRLSQVADGGGTIADYSYNALGQRVRKQVGGVMGPTTYFIYGLNGELLAEHDGGGNVIREYHRVEGELMGMSVGTSVYAVYTDHLGTPQVVADASATHVWEATYQPFGAVELVVNTVDMPLRFPGQYFDDETGNHYNYFRDYDPTLGRYLTSDPIGLAGGLNTFMYVGGNPLLFIDPEGLKIPDALIAGCQGVGCRGVNTYEPDGLRCGGCEDPLYITYTSGLPQARIKPDVTKAYSVDCLVSLGFGEVAGTVAESAAVKVAEHGLRAAGRKAAAAAVRFLGSPPVTAYNFLKGMEEVFSQCECVQ